MELRFPGVLLLTGLLQGKAAVITGAGRGIGRGIALGMAGVGAAVAVWDIVGENAERVAEQIRGASGRSVACVVDVSAREQVEAACAHTVQKLGLPTILVNNAGLISGAPFFEIDDEEWDRILEVNLKAVFIVTQVIARHMRESGGGSVINVSSIGAERPTAGSGTAYHASKGGVEGLTRTMAVNLAPYGIRVNCLSPGYIASNPRPDYQPQPETLARVPLGRVGTPEDFVGPAVFLASEMSAYITGQVLHVDGGAVILGQRRLDFP